MTKLKHVLRLQYGSALASEDRIAGRVPVFGSNGQIDTHTEGNMLSPAIVVGRKGSYGKVSWAQEGGFCIDTAYFVDRRYTQLTLRYAFYLLQILGLDKMSNDTAIPGLARDDADNKRIPDHTAIEQPAIANFLDRETAHIDQLIAKKERMVVVIQEERSAMISLAVTRGFGQNAPLRETSSPYLPLIPENWTMQRLKQLAVVRGGITLGRQLPPGVRTFEIPYLRVANVQAGRLDLSTVTLLDATKSEIKRYSLQPNDVLMNEGGDNDKLGRGAVWDGSINPCMHQNHVFAVRPHDSNIAPWIALASDSRYGRDFFFLNSKQSTNLASISKSKLEQFPIALPEAAERIQILATLEARLRRCDSLIESVGQTINRLREFRLALITAAVTGQIDVATWRRRGYTERRLDALACDEDVAYAGSASDA